jgi:hypothetical protein
VGSIPASRTKTLKALYRKMQGFFFDSTRELRMKGGFALAT